MIFPAEDILFLPHKIQHFFSLTKSNWIRRFILCLQFLHTYLNLNKCIRKRLRKILYCKSCGIEPFSFRKVLRYLLTPVHVTNENSLPQIMASIRRRAFNTNRVLDLLREGRLQSFLSNFPLITAHVECFIKQHAVNCPLQRRNFSA